MTLWQNLDMSERIAAVQTTAAKKNIEDRAVEKDWWVTAVLRATRVQRALCVPRQSQEPSWNAPTHTVATHSNCKESWRYSEIIRIFVNQKDLQYEGPDDTRY